MEKRLISNTSISRWKIKTVFFWYIIMKDIIGENIEVKENAKKSWNNNDKSWARQIDEGQLLNIKVVWTLLISFKNKDKKKPLEIKLGAKRQNKFIFKLKHLWK